MDTKNVSGTMQSRAAKLADDLERLSEAMRARNADARSEVKEAVDVLADELIAISKSLRAVPSAALRDELAVQSHLALLEAKDKLAVVDASVRDAFRGVAQSARFLGDTAKLKLALAKLEASDLVDEKRRAARRQQRRLEALGETTWNELDDRVAHWIGEAMLK